MSGEPDGATWRLYGAALGIYLRSAPGWAVADIAISLLSGMVPVAAAWATKDLIDNLTARNLGIVTVLAVVVAALGGVASVMPDIAQYAGREIERRITLHALEALFGAIARMPGLSQLEDPVLHNRLQLAQQAAERAPRELFTALMSSLQSAVTVAGFAVGLASVSPVITGLVLCAAVPALVAESFLARRSARVGFQMSPRIRRQLFYASLLTDPRAGKEIRMLRIGPFLCGRMVTELRAAQEGERGVDRTTAWTEVLLSALGALVAGVAIVLAVEGIASGTGSVGDLVLLTAGLIGVQSGLSSIITRMAMAHSGLILFGHYVAVIRAAPEAPHPTRVRVADPSPAHNMLQPVAHRIELRDVWFRYHADHTWVLRGVDLTMPAGTATALVGANGSGKSTLVKLLCRLYEPDRGVILLDGTDIRDLPVDALRERVSTVFQDFMSYDLTVRDNIGLGDLSALDDLPRLRRAARWSGMDEFLTRLPRGYDTMLTRLFEDESDPMPGGDAAHTGVVLSGGQWQRLALSRAVLRTDTGLLILDEPSSGLDPDAEAELHARLTDYREGRTTLLISHRLNAIRDADSIVVLDGGRIVEKGDHDTLISANGNYARMFRAQASGYRRSRAETSPR